MPLRALLRRIIVRPDHRFTVTWAAAAWTVDAPNAARAIAHLHERVPFAAGAHAEHATPCPTCHPPEQLDWP